MSYYYNCVFLQIILKIYWAYIYIYIYINLPSLSFISFPNKLSNNTQRQTLPIGCCLVFVYDFIISGPCQKVWGFQSLSRLTVDTCFTCVWEFLSVYWHFDFISLHPRVEKRKFKFDKKSNGQSSSISIDERTVRSPKRV